MFGKTIKLFKVSGIWIGIDPSWFIIAVLVVWSLAGGVFPELYPDLPTATCWAMGVIGALGLFASIILHELGHATAAQRYDLPIRSITLFIFGGVASMEEEPRTPSSEFWVAVAGPIVSVLIAVATYGGTALGRGVGWPTPVTGVLGFLATINTVLVVFNAVPAFPLDGGRVLRSILWRWKGNLRWATRVTSSLGSGFGIFLIVLGVIDVLLGAFVQGMWWFLLGMFLRSAAQMSYQQLLIRRALEGEPVRRFMNPEPRTVPPDTPISRLVDDYVYTHHHKMFPVTENGDLRGCVTTREIKNVPREEWDGKRVGEVMTPCDAENTVDAGADAMKTLIQMSRTGQSRVLVVEDGRLLGVLTLKDLMKFITLKLDLEEDVELGTARAAMASN